jgi:predicted metal-binding membrane protein
MLRSSSDLFGGSVFILAGGYQLTMMKDTCLSHCRTPLSFINGQGGFRPSAAAALQLGLKHGLYCVGCCWALMAVLFVVGVMELLWIAVISIWVLLEKVFPARGVMTQLSGLVLIGTGIILLASTVI